MLVQDRALLVKAEGCCPRDGGGAIYRLDLGDGSSRRARTFTRVLPGLAAAPGAVVFTAEDGLRRLTATGEALLAPGTFEKVAAAPDRVFARTSDRVVQLLGLDGGATRLEPLVEGLFAGPIATDGEAVFFSTRAGDALSLEALWPPGGALRLATRADDGLIGPVAHRGHVYWHDRGAIMRIPSGGGGVTSLGHVGFGVGGLAVDDRHLYFISVGRPCNLADEPAPRRFGGALHRVPVGGGVVEDLQVDLVSPGAIALDDTHVYWTGGSNVTVETALFRAPK